MTKHAELIARLEGVEEVDPYACKCEDGLFPQYGVGPHICFWKKPGGKIGQSDNSWTLESWPDDFFLEIDRGDTLESLSKGYSVTGIYVCPEHGPKHGRWRNCYSRDAVAALLKAEGG
jgi:hypothetical protein